jgi:alkaline phosphatase D
MLRLQLLLLAAFFYVAFGAATPLRLTAQQNPVIEVRDYSRSFGKPSGREIMDDRLLPFAHGVASGDPLSDRVIIWTRVTVPSEQTVNVDWRVATDTAMRNIVKSGIAVTTADRDYTVKVDVTGLTAGTTYYYNFTALGKNSLTGRTRTTPAVTGPNDRLRLAVVSCSNYNAGYFNVYGRIADRQDLDAVLHLGDYIYEYAPGKYGTDTTRGRQIQPRIDVVTLNDYRIRYSTYRLDPDLIRVHQQHPFITIWDDHETANDSWQNGAENHNAATQGTWENRKANGKRTYFEWMPIRENVAPNTQRIYRAINFGGLADIFMLDTRLEGREIQIAGKGAGPDDGIPTDTAKWLDTNRTIMGREQFSWLQTRLSGSTAKWKILGNQTQMMSVKRPVIPSVSNGGFLSLDAWDGYPAERRKLLTFLQSRQIQNVAVVTGDIHSTWAADLPLDPFNPQLYSSSTGTGSVAVEFVTPSITADNFDEVFAPFGFGRPQIIGGFLNPARAVNPHIKTLEGFENGYMVVDVANDKMQTDWYFVDGIRARTTNERFYEGWMTMDGQNRLTKATAAVPSKANSPAPAPVPTSVNDNKNNQTFTATAGQGFAVIGNYPNPASDATIINYVLTQTKRVSIKLFDLSGRELYTLLDTQQAAGNYGVAFDVSKLASGAYVYRCAFDGVSVSRNLIVQR